MANKKIKVSEKEVLNSIKQYLLLMGYSVWRINNMGTYNSKTQGYYFHGDKGIPDLIAIKNNLLLFLECKSSTGKTTAEQKEFLNALDIIEIVRGGVVHSIEDVKRLIV